MTFILNVSIENEVIDVVVLGGSFGEYEPFSNCGKFPVQYNRTTFPTLEHAYMHTNLWRMVMLQLLQLYYSVLNRTRPKKLETRSRSQRIATLSGVRQS